jgi:hypothetical protein
MGCRQRSGFLTGGADMQILLARVADDDYVADDDEVFELIDSILSNEEARQATRNEAAEDRLWQVTLDLIDDLAMTRALTFEGFEAKQDLYDQYEFEGLILPNLYESMMRDLASSPALRAARLSKVLPC